MPAHPVSATSGGFPGGFPLARENVYIFVTKAQVRSDPLLIPVATAGTAQCVHAHPIRLGAGPWISFSPITIRLGKEEAMMRTLLI